MTSGRGTYLTIQNTFTYNSPRAPIFAASYLQLRLTFPHFPSRMAARAPSSRLLTHLLRARKTSRTQALPCTSLRPNHRLTYPSTRFLSSTPLLLKENPNTAPPPPSQSSTNASTTTTQTPTGSTQQSSSPDSKPHKTYTFTQLSTLLQSPPSSTPILIDVREPSELATTGRIPSALNLPLKSSPDFAFLSPEEFEDRFGRPRPTEKDEVIFYCRSGVRSKAAAELAKRAGFGGRVAEFPGSWLEWEKMGGEVER
jgi:rhodanese-related sulfurtransferase